MLFTGETIYFLYLILSDNIFLQTLHLSLELTMQNQYLGMCMNLCILLNHTVNHATMFRDHLKCTKTAGHHQNET